MIFFKDAIIKYQKYHTNIYNRIIHILVLIEIPYTIFLFKNKQVITGIIYYILFNHFIPYYFGHKIENNKKDVNYNFNNSIKKLNVQSLLFFSFYSPFLRLYDLYILINQIIKK